MTINEETIKQAMDAYGNLRHEIELLKGNRQTTIDSILAKYPNVKEELESVDDELGAQLEKAQEQEKYYKKLLEDMLGQFSKDAIIKDKLELKTPLLKVTLTKKVFYDSKALDGMAVENSKLLTFRTEEITSRITLNKI